MRVLRVTAVEILEMTSSHDGDIKIVDDNGILEADISTIIDEAMWPVIDGRNVLMHCDADGIQYDAIGTVRQLDQSLVVELTAPPSVVDTASGRGFIHKLGG